MQIILLVVGKTSERWIEEATHQFTSRLKHYISFQLEVVPDVKAGKRSADEIRQLEGQALQKKLSPTDHVILLDEKGKEFTSRLFAQYVQKILNASPKRLIFVVGGAFGFSEDLYKRANGQISLSQMTLTHQMIRPFFAEQLYRAFTILRGEKYHND